MLYFYCIPKKVVLLYFLQIVKRNLRIADLRKSLTRKSVREVLERMLREEVLERALRSYKAYYDVDIESPEEPFVAEAAFHSHDDAYFLVKGATIGEAESNEFVFFASVEELSEPLLRELDEAAWEKGISRVKPHVHHRNTDVTVIVIADRVEEAAQKAVRSLKHYKNYLMSLQGFSHYHLIVVDTSSGKKFCNRQGQSLKKILNNIL